MFLEFYLSSVWLSYDQLLAITKRTAMLNQLWSLHFKNFNQKVAGSIVTRLGL